MDDGSRPLAITGATLIDGTGRPALGDATVVIDSDRIARAGPSAEGRRPTAPRSSMGAADVDSARAARMPLPMATEGEVGRGESEDQVVAEEAIAQCVGLHGEEEGNMAVLRWSQAAGSWRPVEGESPEGLGGAQVGLYETLMTAASAYALTLHADRIARSWERLTGRPFAAEALPPLHHARTEVIRQQWPAWRFEVRWFADGGSVAQIRRRDKPSVKPPVQLLPVESGASDAAYPHKSVEWEHLTQAYKRAVAAGDDALFVVGGEVREAAQAFVGFVTDGALVLPLLRADVLPSTTRTAAADWCRELGRAVVERPIRMDELGAGTLIYGNALIGLLPAFAAGCPAVPPPDWFDAAAIERRLAE